MGEASKNETTDELAAGADGPSDDPPPSPFDRALTRTGRGLLDFLLPARCPVTDAAVAEAGQVAPAAWARMHFIAPPYCDICGAPFSYDQGEGAMCAGCAAARPAFDAARAAFVYDDYSRGLILRFKHGDRWDGVALFGRWLAGAGAEALAGADLIAPTPLHWRRLAARRFNQAGVLAQETAKHVSVTVALDLLKRTRSTPSQGGLSADGRRRNVAGAFAVRHKWAERVKGAHVVLVDDVLTTGATLSACAQVLKRAGAARVDALTLARTIRGGHAAL